MREKIRQRTAKNETKEKRTIQRSYPLSAPSFLDSPVEQIIHLQSTIGNRAVTELIESGAIGIHHREQRLTPGMTADMIQRYYSYEHASLDDEETEAETFSIKGMEITAAEMNALADFYAGPDDILRADRQELVDLIRLIRQQRQDPSSVSDADWDEATNGRYSDLALINYPHFGPHNENLTETFSYPLSGFLNFNISWLIYHRRALEIMLAASRLEDSDARGVKERQAMIINAFGDHFLTDAFSSGHLVNKSDIMAGAERRLSELTADELDELFQTIAQAVFATHGTYISQFEADLAGPWWPNIDSPDRFKSLLEGIYEEDPRVVYNAFLLAVHDRINNREFGIPVVNNRGDYWNLSGDGTLNAETRTLIEAAIAKSRANLDIVLQTGETDFETLAGRVLDYFPRLTEESENTISSIIDEVTDLQGGGMSGTIIQILNSQIELIFEALLRRGIVRRVE